MSRLRMRLRAAAAAAAASFKQLKIGAGGFLTGLDIAPDGTTVVRTDTFGAYKWNGFTWDQLFTTTSLPAGEYGRDAATGDWINTEGIYEISIAPNDSSRMYAMLGGKMYRTDNGGTSWSRLTGFSAISVPSTNANPNEQGDGTAAHGLGRTSGRRMAVDPFNKDICYAGAGNGIWKTSNAGVTWTQISTGSIPTPTFPQGGMFVCFDDTSSHPGTPAVTQVIYVGSYGNGVYKSSDGGSTWALTTSSPTLLYKMICRNGTLWLIDNNVGNHLLSFNGTAWSSVYNVASQNDRCAAVDVDPLNPSRIVVVGDGGFHSVSTNGGTSFTGWAFGVTRSAVAPEPVWLKNTNEDFMSCGDIRFHPTNSNELWFAEGISPWVGNPSDTPGVVMAWSAKARNIEQLVSNGVLSPPGGVPLVYGWDRPIFRVADPLTYPTDHGPDYTASIVHAGSADWASTHPNCIFVLCNRGFAERTSVSNDGGINWNLITLPASNVSGCVAAASNQNFVYIPGNDSIAIYYTTDGGTNWNAGSITGPISAGQLSGFASNQFIDRQILCADRVNPNTFYVYYNGTQNSDNAGTNADGARAGIYKSTDSGATWTKVYAGRLNDSVSGNSRLTICANSAMLRSVPNLGSTSTAGHLFFTAGDVGGSTTGPLYRSVDGSGAIWSIVPNVTEAVDIGFGAPAPGQSYPAIYLAGYVNGTASTDYGIWRSDDNCVSWTKLGDYPAGNFDFPKCISGDSNTYGKCYVGFLGSGWAYYGS